MTKLRRESKPVVKEVEMKSLTENKKTNEDETPNECSHIAQINTVHPNPLSINQYPHKFSTVLFCFFFFLLKY